MTSCGMKRDGRTFDHQTLEAIRLMAIERVREGERAAEVIASYGFNRTTIYKWIAAAFKPGVGIKVLHAKPATGRPRTLSPAQERQVFRWINGRDPRQYGLDFGLWTRAIVAQLIEKMFAIRLGVTAVGELLAKLGLTPQKPLQRAYQRDPEAIARWQRETYPAIVRQAKAQGAEVFFWDESGFRADTVHGKTWGVRGHTPVVTRPGQRQSISAASAVNTKGAFWFCIYEGALNAELFVDLLKKMMRHRQSQPPLRRHQPRRSSTVALRRTLLCPRRNGEPHQGVPTGPVRRSYQLPLQVAQSVPPTDCLPRLSLDATHPRCRPGELNIGVRPGRNHTRKATEDRCRHRAQYTAHPLLHRLGLSTACALPRRRPPPGYDLTSAQRNPGALIIRG